MHRSSSESPSFVEYIFALIYFFVIELSWWLAKLVILPGISQLAHNFVGNVGQWSKLFRLSVLTFDVYFLIFAFNFLNGLIGFNRFSLSQNCSIDGTTFIFRRHHHYYIIIALAQYHVLAANALICNNKINDGVMTVNANKANWEREREKPIAMAHMARTMVIFLLIANFHRSYFPHQSLRLHLLVRYFIHYYEIHSWFARYACQPKAMENVFEMWKKSDAYWFTFIAKWLFFVMFTLLLVFVWPFASKFAI